MKLFVVNRFSVVFRVGFHIRLVQMSVKNEHPAPGKRQHMSLAAVFYILTLNLVKSVLCARKSL